MLARAYSVKIGVIFRCPVWKTSNTVYIQRPDTFLDRHSKVYDNGSKVYLTQNVWLSARCLLDSPKPDSPKLELGLGFRVRVSANRDWTQCSW